MSAHYVYRVYDSESRLIYVGCTGNLPQRLQVHGYGYTAWWNSQATKVAAKVYPSKAIAREAESSAIRSERPRWNITGKWGTNADWSEGEFHDFMTALLHSPEFGPGTLRRAHRVADIYKARFGHEIPLELPGEVA